MTEEKKNEELLRLEAAFWDRQEDEIKKLYARPHDWRFAPEIANAIIKPKFRFMTRWAEKLGDELKTVLDIGCGNGWFCHFVAEGGIRAYGCDIAPKKIETARQSAKERKLDHLCNFFAGDIMDYHIPEKVDLLTAHGSLHHFPNLEEILPKLVERYLRPGGYMLFIEPHHEGMSPGIAKFLLGMANSPRWGKIFDREFYLEASGKKLNADGVPVDPEGAHDHSAPHEMPKEESFNIRGESPAGLAFFGEEPDMGEILKSRYELVDEKFFLYFLGHFSNAFYIYMKSPFWKKWWKRTLPFWIAMDDLLCRFSRFNQYAEEGAWLLRRRT